MSLDLENRLSEILSGKLPGVFSQMKMSPTVRFIGKGFPEDSTSATKSAVLILFYPDDDFYGTVFIERNKYPGAHSGQISLPGGKYELSDDSLKFTALREAEEEVGVDASTVNIVGSLTKLFVPVSNYIIYPYVGFVKKKPVFTPEVKEVNSIIEIRVKDLFNNSNKKSELLENKSYSIMAPYFDAKGHHIWGATAMILSELNEILLKNGILE